MSFEIYPGVTAGREELRRMASSQGPFWLKDIAQATLDWADDISRLHAAPLVPWALPLLPPQLPPGNGQPNCPCPCCSSTEGHKFWCIEEVARIYGGAFSHVYIQWPLWRY